MAGDTVTLNCSVTLPIGVTDFHWEGPGEVNPAPPTTNGQEVSSVLTLSTISTSQAGQYICTATLNGSSIPLPLLLLCRVSYSQLSPYHVEHISSSVPVPTPSTTISGGAVAVIIVLIVAISVTVVTIVAVVLKYRHRDQSIKRYG